MAKNRKNDSSEPIEPLLERLQPITSLDRRLIAALAAVIPALFIALGAFVWRINDRVTTLEGKLEVTESRTMDRYTKQDAHEDHQRVDKWVEEMRKRINELSADVNQFKGVPGGHRHPPP